MTNAFHRRTFLQGMGGSLLSLPVLPSLLPRAARAQAGAKPLRFVALWMNHSVHSEEWWRTFPTQATQINPEFARVPYTRLADGTLEYDITKHQGPLGSVFSTRWDGLRDKIALLHGIEDYGANVANVSSHNCAHFLCGHWPTGPDSEGTYAKSEGESIDNLIIEKVYAATPPHKRIYLRFPHDDWGHGMLIWERAGTTLQAVRDTVGADVAFDLIFAGRTATSSVTAAQRRLAQKKTVVDGVLAQVNGILGSPRTSAHDKEKLRQYAQLVQEQQQRIDALAKMTTAARPPARPIKFQGPWTETLLRDFLKAQVTNVAAALKTNTTQVAVLRTHGGTEWAQVFGSTQGDLHYDYHARALQYTTPARKLVFDGFAELIQQLSEVEDPATGETYLDNTVILFGTDHGNEDHFGHSLPIFLAGGKIRTGRAYDYSRYDRPVRPNSRNRWYPGRPYTQVLAALSQIYGLDMAAVKARTKMRYVSSDNLFPQEWDKPLPHLVKSV